MGGTSSKEQPDYWQKDEDHPTCALCSADFTFFTRRHHCRQCGCIACSDCMRKSRAPSRGYKDKVPVCKSCCMASFLGGGGGTGGLVGTLVSAAAAVATKNEKSEVQHDYSNLSPTELGKALYTAAGKGEVGNCKTLIQKYDADVNWENKDSSHKTPLHEAVWSGHKAVVKLLLENAADPNAADTWKKTPLFESASDGVIDMCELLLQYGADPNFQDFTGMTPLHRAANSAFNDNTKVLKLLIEKYGADTTIKHFGDKIQGDDGDYPPRTVLEVAEQNSRPKPGVIAYLKSVDGKKFDMTTKNSNDEEEQEKIAAIKRKVAERREQRKKERVLGRALHKAIEEKQIDKIKELVSSEEGKAINLINWANSEHSDDTALHHAVSPHHGNPEIVRVLLEAGANPNARNSWKKTPLYDTIFFKEWESFLLLLETGKADPNIRDFVGETSLHHAANAPFYDETDYVEKLIEHGADPTVRHEDGKCTGSKGERYGARTPSEVARDNDKKNIYEFLEKKAEEEFSAKKKQQEEDAAPAAVTATATASE